MAQQWFCRHCRKPQSAMMVHGKPRVARFRTGFVGVQLTCRHWAAVRLDKL